MKKIGALLLILGILFSAVACQSLDESGKYRLSKTGEAIIDDISGTGYVCNDNNRVFYQIFVGSFSDSDGDGIGDLRGIINRFDYLNDGNPSSGKSLGIEGIWLSPIFRSPSYHKYDVTDYYEIDPSFGSEEDLGELIELCRARNVKIILDLPINHTGSRNMWFIRFLNARKAGDTSDPYYGFYVYSDTVGSGGKVFTKLQGTAGYYESNFGGDMPEPDFDNGFVRETMLGVAKYYLDLGVDGFRFDAAKYIYFGEESRNVEFWKWYIGELKKIKSDVYTVGEVWSSDSLTVPYFEVLNCFDFSTSQTSGLIAETAKAGNANIYTAYVERYIGSIRAKNESAMFIPFISNHDMDRSAGYLTLASGYMKMAANLTILGPGSPFIYYGEEIGMKGSRGGANTDANRRLAMLWGDGDTVKDPEGTTYLRADQTNGTVIGQIADGDSLLSHYKKLIMIRNANSEIARGEYTALHIQGSKLGGFVSTYQGEYACVIHNTTRSEQTLDLSTATGLSLGTLAAVIGEGASLDGTVLTIGAQTSVVIRK